jgi:uncharacterized protein with von Willebrand factor type A (vWA) domain
VGTGRVLTFWKAAQVVPLRSREDLYFTARSTLVSRPEDFDVFDDAFRAYFAAGVLEETLRALLARAAPAPPEPAEHGDREDGAGDVEAMAAEWTGLEDDAETEGEAVVRMVASGVERLKNKSFDELTDHERRLCDTLIRRLSITMPLRHSRRLGPARKAGRFDFRRTMRHSLRTEGEPFRRAWRDRKVRRRPLVLILDVSGSMTQYSRALLQFGHVAMRTGHRVEVFCFGTRLTRLTRPLRTKDPDDALAEVTRTVRDFDGGTRIGDSLKQLLDDRSHTAALRSAVVVLCSDGLERGDPAVLREQMERLARVASRVIWVNPLKGSPHYQPLARGMAAALPHLDVFVPGHNVASLEALGELISHPPRR